MIEAEWRTFDTGAQMAHAVSAGIAGIVQRAIAARGGAFVALPGGRTPRPTFERLAATEIAWNKVTIVPTDDRLVPATDPLSNAALIARYFSPRGARVVPIASGAVADYRAAGQAADAELAKLDWPPDLVWLGVGADGHTASIFPGPDLDAALDGSGARRAVGVMPDPLPPEAPVARVTLTRGAIVSARALVLALSGEAKRALVECALRSGPHSRTPIGQVLAKAAGPIEIYWSAT